MSSKLLERDLRSLSVTIKPVTSEADVSQLANINKKALEGDPIKEWMGLYTERTDWRSTVEAVTGALTDPNFHMVKAVIPDPETEGEKVIGFAHWMCGYIHLSRGYSSAQSNCKKDILEPRNTVENIKDPASDITRELSSEASRLEVTSRELDSKQDKDCARRLKKGEMKYTETRNHYIGAIRGKKHIHIRRIMVLPEFQGYGVGKKLMKAVTDDADRQKIACWLFARPAGEPLYVRSGFKVVSVTVMDEPEDDFVCPASKGMMRLPQPMTDQSL